MFSTDVIFFDSFWSQAGEFIHLELRDMKFLCIWKQVRCPMPCFRIFTCRLNIISAWSEAVSKSLSLHILWPLNALQFTDVPFHDQYGHVSNQLLQRSDCFCCEDYASMSVSAACLVCIEAVVGWNSAYRNYLKPLNANRPSRHSQLVSILETNVKIFLNLPEDKQDFIYILNRTPWKLCKPLEKDYRRTQTSKNSSFGKVMGF